MRWFGGWRRWCRLGHAHRWGRHGVVGTARREKRQEAETRLGLPQPTGGRKEYKDADGKVVKVVEWFGYKLHLLVDVRHELALAYRITTPAVGDNEMIGTLVEQARRQLADGSDRIAGLRQGGRRRGGASVVARGGDQAVDRESRRCGRASRNGCCRATRGDRTWCTTKRGRFYCYDKVSTPIVRHRMAYIGHEARRGTLKYRCPAHHEGWTCPSDARCNGGRRYGLVARIKSELDLRRFPPIPRMTKQFERLYKGRTAVERVNARLKLYWGADDGNVMGARRFHAMVGVVMLVHLALATTLARSERGAAKTLGGTRLSPIGPLRGGVAVNANGHLLVSATSTSATITAPTSPRVTAWIFWST